MYLTLYRKYRPKTFEEFVGQEMTVKILKNQIEQEKIGHAYLFAGPKGTGKTSLAKIFSAVINCENPSKSKQCGECINCTQKENVDIIEIDAASNNGVEEIRDIKGKIQLTPANSKYKVYIIDEIHMLTTSAFNALLKTLEEPPSHVIFILATTEIHKLPETILSRCQKMEFKKISTDDITKRLNQISKAENFKITDDILEIIAANAGGGLRDAIGILESISNLSSDTIEKEIVLKLLGIPEKKVITDLLNSIEDDSISKLEEKIETIINANLDYNKIYEKLFFEVKNKLVETNDNKYLEYIKKISEAITKNVNITNNSFKIFIYSLFFINNVDQTVKAEVKNKVIKEIKEDNNISPAEKVVHEKKQETIKTEKPISKQVEKVNTKEETSNRDELEKLKKIRVNNAFAGVSRKILNDFKNIFKSYDYMFFSDIELKNYNLIKDGNFKVLGNNILINVFETQTVCNHYNSSINEIEMLLSKIKGETIKTIGLNTDEWEEKRKEFKSRTKEYELINEEEAISKYNKMKKEEKKGIEKDFAHLIKRR